MEKYSHMLHRLILQYKLAFALGSAIGCALLLTVISLILYNVTGSSKLDLSRPGYDSARKQLKKTDESSSDDFRSSGSLTAEVMKQYLQKYQTHSKELGGYDDFNQKLLDDSQLGLTSPNVVTPSDGANP